MIENHQIQKEKRTIEISEEEIELIDYLLVIWKYKYMILIGILLFSLFAGIFGFITWKQQPKMFLTEMTIQPGVKGVDGLGHRIYIDTLENMKALIEEELHYGIFDSVNHKLFNPSDFKLDILNASKMLKVSVHSKTANEGIDKSNHIVKTLQAKYTELIKIIQKEDKSLLGSEQSEIISLYAEESKVKFIINKIKTRLDELKKQVAVCDNNSKTLLILINKLKENSGQNIEYQIMQGTNIIMQNMRLRNEYRDKILEHLSKREEMRIELNWIQNRISEVEKKIRNIEEVEKIIKPVEIRSHPMTKLLPKKEYNVKQTVVLAAFVGLFCTIFMAFFIEYIHRYKKKFNIKSN